VTKKQRAELTEFLQRCADVVPAYKDSKFHLEQIKTEAGYLLKQIKVMK